MTPPPERCRAKNRATCRNHGFASSSPATSQIPAMLSQDAPGHLAYQHVLNATRVTPSAAMLQQIKVVPLKRASVEDLAHMVVAEVDALGMSKEKTHTALLLAAFLHRDVTRNDPNVGSGSPYIGHPLRNAVRGIRLGSESEIVVIGNLMHDTVEDHPFEMAEMLGVHTDDEEVAREHAFALVQQKFGSEAYAMVKGMSNPIMPRYMPAEEKNKIYAEHVAHAIENPDVLVGKSCDFKDNALSLKHSRHHMSPVAVGKRARKYLPVLEILHARIAGSSAQEVGLSEHGRLHLINSFEQGREWLKVLSTADSR